MTPADWSLVKQVFEAALDRGVDERRTLVEKACAGRPEVQAEVESLLNAHQSAGSFLDSPALPGLGESGTKSWIGRRVGPYRLVAEIGHGGMGTVFRAERDDDQFRKQVAVKFIGAGFAHPEMLRRFLDERQILATLDHPNIASLLDGGVTDDGMPYMVMDYITGQPVTEYCRKTGLGLRPRLEIFRTIALAVHYAHQRLVVHRDIKPANILVTPEGSPVLLDFGIAKALNPAAAGGADTQAFFRPMTPDYASPEQLRGAAVTTATDVYSLGVLLYELLTGARPYPLADATPPEAARIVCETEPPKPSSRINAAGLKLPGDLDFITLKAMRKEPQDRYGSAQELADDVRRYLDGLPVLARKGSLRYVARKMMARHKLAVGAVVAGVALAAIGVSAIVREARVANMERAKAQNRFNELRGLANSVIFELHDDIARLSGSTEVRKKLVSRALAYLDSLAKESAGDVGLQAELAAAYLRLGDVLGKPSEPNLGDPAGALASYRKGLSVAEAALSRNPARDDLLRQIGLLYLGIGEIHVSSGRSQEARESLEHGLRVLRSRHDQKGAGGGRRSDLATALLDLFVATRFNDPTGARNALNRAEELYEADLSEKPNDRAAQNHVALTHRYLATLENDDGALTHLQRSLELDRRRSAANPADARARLDISTDLAEIGRRYMLKEQPGRALKPFQECLAIREELATADPKNVLARSRLAYAHLVVGDAHFHLGEAAAAAESMRKSAAIYAGYTAEFPNDRLATASLLEAYTVMGKAEGRLGNHRAACEAFQKSGVMVAALTKQTSINDWTARQLPAAYAEWRDLGRRNGCQ